MTKICTAPFYAEVPWRGRPGAELCGVIFNYSSRGSRRKLASAGTRCGKLYSHLVPAGVPTANFRPAIFCRRSPAAAYSLGVKSPVEVPGRARDGSEEEQRSGRDGTATAATCPAVLRGEARRKKGGAQLSAVDLDCTAGAGRRPNHQTGCRAPAGGGRNEAAGGRGR
jgi:hypothetical protein